MKNRTGRKPINLAIIVVLVAISVFLLGTLAARYITDGISSGNARTARWDADVQFTDPVSPIPEAEGESWEYDKSVTACELKEETGTVNHERTGYYIVEAENPSETASRVTLYVSGMPDGMEVHAIIGEESKETEALMENGKAVFGGNGESWELAPGESMDKVKLYFTAGEDVPSDIYNNIEVCVKMDQID